MTMQFSDTVRNARADAVETAVGASAVMTIRTGKPPANVAAGATGTVLATLNLPSDWMAAASAGAKALAGSWADASADASGRPGHFRITASNGTTQHIQGIAAGPWQASTAYLTDDHVTNDTGKLYRATAGGTSAGSGGPTGTGGSITDSGVTWAYVQAAADLAIDAALFTAGQGFTVTSFGWTEGNG